MKDIDIDRWCESVRGFVRETFNQNGRMIPHAIVLATVGPNGEQWPQPRPIPVFPDAMANNRHKDAFAEHVGELTRKLRALAVIFIAEAWFVQAAADQSMDEARREAYRYGESLEDNPERKEMVFVSLEKRCSGAVYFWAAEIDRTKGHARLAEFKRSDGDKATGRFTGLIARAD